MGDTTGTSENEEVKSAALSLTVDVVIFSLRPRDPLQLPEEPGAEIQQELHVLLVRRANAPFKGCWALTGAS